MAKRKFHTRSFISFSLLITIVWLLISGTVLYIAPPGRVAHWQHWTLFGFDKDQWQAQHTIFSYLFIIVSAIHIFSLNWRNLWSYIKLKSKSGLRKRREFVAAIALAIVVFAGTSYEIPPLSSFNELGENIGFSWEEKQKQAPIPHTENLTLEEVAAKYLDKDIDEVITELKEKGIVVNDKLQTLKEIAIQNGMAPSDIYSAIGTKRNMGSGGSGKGYGRMTIEEVARDSGVSVDEILKVLESNGIDANANNTIKDIASDHGMHPSEIVRMIKGDH